MTADNDIARERYRSIQQLARDLGRPTDELLTLYVMEGFIARASESVYTEQLVSKGRMLISTFAERRPTPDIDLQALTIPNDTESLTMLRFTLPRSTTRMPPTSRQKRRVQP